MARKVTFETVRKIALGLPGVEESTSYGGPSLKLHGKLFTCRAIHKSAEPDSLILRIDFEQRDALIAEEPGTYYLTDHYVNYPTVLVRLSRVDAAMLTDLLKMSWRFVTANSPRPARKRTKAKQTGR